LAWQWLISGFGEVRPTTGDRGYGQTVSGPSYAQAVKFELRYPGQVFDEETGLSYNLHRYYDVAAGRYIQADPIGLEGGWNRFGYVGGDPLNAIDPDGLNAVVALNRIAELGRGLYYRYGPAITEFIAGASGVNGAVASPAAINPLVAQIPTTVSRMAPIAQAINQGIDTGAYCSAKSIDELVIQFGKVENQISHTFRHVERAGFNRQLVQDAIREDILRTADSLIDGQYSGSVILNGAKIDYSAFKLPNGIINVGRITPPR
jgi:RHS repeat-associated protein